MTTSCPPAPIAPSARPSRRSVAPGRPRRGPAAAGRHLPATAATAAEPAPVASPTGLPGAPTDDPVRGGDGPRRRHDPVRAGRSGHGPVQATRGRSLVGRWRHAARAARRPAVGQGDARRPDAAAPDRRRVDADPVVAVGPADLPYLDPATAFVAQPAAAVDPGALKREVFGFLPYWELSDSSTRLDWEKLSTVAYFGVGAPRQRQPPEAQQRRLDDGRLERLDELEDDRRSSTRPTPAARGSS